MKHLLCLFVAALLFNSGCATQKRLRRELNGVSDQLNQAKSTDSARCAPELLATAGSLLTFADRAVQQTDAKRSRAFMDVARLALKKAQEFSGPKYCSLKDDDGDGIPDSVDACPHEKEDYDGYEDADGCPDPDNDSDGVLDAADKCPMVRGEVSNDGCPVVDRDGDGVIDSNDLCPDIPENLDGVEDTDGCPEEKVKDSDGDKITDALDACPNAPEDYDNFRDDDGCPDPDNDLDGILDTADKCPNDAGLADSQGCPITDRDGDGLTDNIDKCPDLPGAKNSKTPGCPPKVLVTKTDTGLALAQPLAMQGVVPKGPVAKLILSQVAAILKSNPKMRLSIEAHAQTAKTADANMKLSVGQANAVRDDLVKRGIDTNRLVAAGFGDTKPLLAAPPVGKKKAPPPPKQRVELRIMP